MYNISYNSKWTVLALIIPNLYGYFFLWKMKSKSDVKAIKSQSILMCYIPVLLKWHFNLNEFSGNRFLHHSSQTSLCLHVYSISQVQTCHTRFDINDAKLYWFMGVLSLTLMHQMEIYASWNLTVKGKYFHWLTTEN